MSKIYKIKSNEKLFNEWIDTCASPHSKVNRDVFAIVQNDMEVPTEVLNEWYKRATQDIQETEKHFTNHIQKLKSLRDKTVNYIKINNQ